MPTNDNFQWDDETLIAFVKDLYDRHPNLEMLAKIKDFKNRKQQAESTPNKEWEIVSLQLGKLIVTDFLTLYHFNKGDLNRIEEYTIHSIKRLSDNELFTIGDKIDGFVNFPISVIDKFVLDSPDKFQIIAYNKEGYGKGFKAWQKAKPIIFTTYDGKEIRQEDRVWYVHRATFTVDFHDFIKYGDEDDYRTYPDLYFYFSTEEAAKEYVLMNKPVLSLEEIKGWLEKYFNYPDGININGLIELAQSKL